MPYAIMIFNISKFTPMTIPEGIEFDKTTEPTQPYMLIRRIAGGTYGHIWSAIVEKKGN